MATELTLDGHRVWPDGTQTIKLTRENPYFTRSESYTLDVTLPMDIMENRAFFGSLHRIERKKEQEAMACRLTVDNRVLLNGSAKVTQVTERDVKVQLVGGMSEINFLSSENKTYIDEMDLTVEVKGEIFGQEVTMHIPDPDIGLKFMPAYDETYDDQVNKWNNGANWLLAENEGYYAEAPQPQLVGLMKAVMRRMGYTITENSTDAEPWNCIYIASAKRTQDIARVLPHWLVRDFVTEYCNFFNCSLIIDQPERTVRIVGNADFFGPGRHTEITPADEYTVELNADDAHSLATDNIAFDMSGSDEHDYDVIPDNVRDSAPSKEYASRSEAYTAYSRMGTEERKKYIFRTPVGLFAGWGHDMSEETGENRTVEEFTQIDVFGPLIRDKENDSETILKICPVAIARTVLEYHDFTNESFGYNTVPGKHPWRYLSLENPAGNEYNRWGSLVDDETVPADDDSTIQEYVEGDADPASEEKEDRMQVYFADDVKMQSVSYDGWDKGDAIEAPMPFTDFLYKRTYSQSHRQWSLSLNPTAADHYLGELHEKGVCTFNMKAKYCVRFLADEMPDPTQVFIIRNKRFACEKIEAQIDDSGLQKLMTGYFYEIL